jgi:ADP-ribose pyrophosphatase YjhB (NUDIX family)
LSEPSARPVVHIAAAIIRRGEEVVLVLQGAAGETPFWALPGGVVDDGELVPEALAREVLEETGLEVARTTRLAFVRQLDNRRPEQLVESRGPGSGYLATVWVFEVDEWFGELRAHDPDGVVHEARLVPLDHAVARLRRTHWLSLAADYLEGRVEPGSLHFERWHADGSAEILA